MTKFVKQPDGGSRLKGEGFEISYQPAENLVCGGDRADGETALIVPHKERTFGTQMLILDGDWREQYEKADGLEGCLKVYEENKAKHRSKWSEDQVYTPDLDKTFEILTAVTRR